MFALGVLLGFLAKYTDGTDIGLIGSYLGFWILTTTIIGVWSRSPGAASLHSFIFLASMLITYYLYSTMLFGFFPKQYFIAWGSIALLSPIGGYVVWHARGNGWFAAFCASLPIGILFAEGYSFFYTFLPARGIDIAFAISLWIILPRNSIQRIRTLLLAFVVMFAAESLGLLYLLPG